MTHVGCVRICLWVYYGLNESIDKWWNYGSNLKQKLQRHQVCCWSTLGQLNSQIQCMFYVCVMKLCNRVKKVQLQITSNSFNFSTQHRICSISVSQSRKFISTHLQIEPPGWQLVQNNLQQIIHPYYPCTLIPKNNFTELRMEWCSCTLRPSINYVIIFLIWTCLCILIHQ